MAAKYYGIIATSNETGSTSVMEMVNASQVSERVGSLIDGDQSVRLFECQEVEFEVEHGATIVHIK